MHTIEYSIAAIVDENGRFHGTGFLVAERHVLTCAHVVEKAGGREAVLTIHFHHNGETVSATVAEDGWHEDLDVALLQLADAPPDTANIAPLAAAEPCDEHPFTTFGYPALGSYRGIKGSGTIKGVVRKDNGRFMLQLTSMEVAQGFSGAPVFDEVRQRVTGMVVEVYNARSSAKLRDTAFALPLDAIWEQLPHLRPPQRQANPFYTNGRINEPALFYGRNRLIREIRRELTKRHSISIVGESQIGKSSLLSYLDATSSEWLPDVQTVYLDLQLVWDITDFCGMALEKLGLTGNTPGELRRALLSRPVILFLDEVEQLADADFTPKLQGMLRALGQEGNFAMCAASQRELKEIFPPEQRVGTSPLYNIFTVKTLGPFAAAEARQFLAQRLAGTPVAFTAADITRIIDESGGHPGKLQRLAKALFDQYATTMT